MENIGTLLPVFLAFCGICLFYRASMSRKPGQDYEEHNSALEWIQTGAIALTGPQVARVMEDVLYGGGGAPAELVPVVFVISYTGAMIGVIAVVHGGARLVELERREIDRLALRIKRDARTRQTTEEQPHA